MNRVILLMMGFICLMFVVGCGQGQSSSFSKEELEKGEGDVASLIGSSEGDSIIDESINKSFMHDPEWLSDHTGHHAPSYRWFMGNGEGEFGYGLAQGQKQPNDSFSLQLIAHEETPTPFNQTVRVQLSELNEKLKVQEQTLSEEVEVDEVDQNTVIYEGRLPDEENKRYLLTMDILSPDGDVEDSMLGLIVVPKEEINAEIMLDEALYDAEDEARLILKNYGPTTLTLGMSYTIEKEIEGEWYVIPLDLAFIQIAILLSPTDMHEQSIDLSDLSPGHYRVIKRMTVEGYPNLTTPIGVEFMVE